MVCPGKRHGPYGLFPGDCAGRYVKVEAGAFDDHAFNTRGLVALDLEGDGDPDLAEVNQGAANAVYRNDGTGSFTQVDPGGFGSIGWVLPIALDANGDGLADLAWRRTVYLGSGTGSFAWFDAGDYTAMGFQYTTTIVAFDADGDGDDDLAVANAGQQWDPCWDWPCLWEPNALFLNDGVGRYSYAGPIGAAGGGGYPIAIAAADLDGDGDLDLVTGNQGWCSSHPNGNTDCHSQGEAVYLNDGNGSFAEASNVFEPYSRGWTWDLAAVDLDGDGDVDLAITNEPLAEVNNEDETSNSIFLNDGTATSAAYLPPRSPASTFDSHWSPSTPTAMAPATSWNRCSWPARPGRRGARRWPMPASTGSRLEAWAALKR